MKEDLKAALLVWALTPAILVAGERVASGAGVAVTYPSDAETVGGLLVASLVVFVGYYLRERRRWS